MGYPHTHILLNCYFFIAEGEEIQNSSLKVYVFLLLLNYVRYKAIVIMIILNVKYILKYCGKQIVY